MRNCVVLLFGVVATAPSYKILRLPWKNVLIIGQTIGHSLKNLGPSQKTLRHPLCPKLVTGLCRAIIDPEHFHKLKPET